MEVYLVGDNQKESWNNFVIGNNGSFLQCFEWGELQKKLGNKVFRLRAGQGSGVSAQALVIEHKLPVFGKRYLYIPYGPCFKDENALEELFERICGLAKERGAIFLRVEPYQNINISRCKNINISTTRLQPQKTLILDIAKPEQEILQGFPKATRYSIRQAQAKGVEIELKDEYSPEFYELLKSTSKKSKFKPHSEAHYKAFFNVKSEYFRPKMCLAKHKDKIIAASVLVMFGKTATYLHAASDKSFNKMQAPTFLVWGQIKLAKQMGCEAFDFWGIDEKKWHGVTNFKKSFAGREVAYPQGKDIVFKKIWYKTYKTYKTY